MNKKLYLSASVVGLVMTGVACGNNDGSNTNSAEGNSSGDSNKVVLYSTMQTDGERSLMNDLIDEFESENQGIEIEANFPGSSYEDQLRVMMAAGELPDLFDTHGWSQLRYGEYTEDLRDMEWVNDLDPAMDQIIKDDDGKVYTFPLNQAQDGVIYNTAILEEYNIEPPTSWDDLKSALEVVRDESDGTVTPLWIGGGDNWTLAQMVDQLLTPAFITDDNNDYSEELVDGSFDWTRYEWLAEEVLELHENDLLNQDVLTAQFAQATEIMANGQAAFMFIVGSVGPDATEMNPEVEVGLLPTPSIHEGDDPSWIGGERFTFSVFNESEMKDEAKMFIDFLAQEDNARRISEATNLSPSLLNVESETYYAEYYDRYSDLEIEPYFDRVYLPSGMWDVLATTTAELIAGGTPEQAAEQMESEYHRLREE